MSRWTGRPARRRAAASSRAGRDGPDLDGREQGPGRGAGQGLRVLVEDHDGLLLLRLPTDDTLLPADVADLARVLRAEDGGTVTIVAVAEGEATAALWPRLSETLDSLRDAGAPSVRLVMSGAGDDRPDRPALARRIAAAWDLTVEAPDGPVLVVPGGSVFVPPGRGGWRRFAPGEEPEALGPRTPAPGWQTALRRVPFRTADGCVVDQIPAGLLIRPVEAAAPRPGDLFHAIPVDPRHPAVVVGVPWGEDVVASDVAEVLGGLPVTVRRGVRLAPGGRRDLLPLGQAVAGLLNAEVEVTTGLPLFAADRPLGTYGIRSVLVGPDGEPRWLPFVDAVMCLPPTGTAPDPASGPSWASGSSGQEGGASAASARSGLLTAPAPRLLRWSSPTPDLGPMEDGVVSLSDAWQAVVTRAGLWVGPHDGAPPRNTRPVSIEGPVVEVGRAGDRLDASLWPVLSRLLGRLAPDVRSRTTLHVHATPPDGGRTLRGLAADHALRVISFAPPSPPARPAPRGGAPVRTVGPARGAPDAATTPPDPRPTPVPPVPVPVPVPVISAGGDDAVSVPAPGGQSSSPVSRAAPATASGEAGPAPAAPKRPATASGPAPAGDPGPPGPTSGPTSSSATPTTEPATLPVAVPAAVPTADLSAASSPLPDAGLSAVPTAEPAAGPAAATSSKPAAGLVSTPVSPPVTESGAGPVAEAVSETLAAGTVVAEAVTAELVSGSEPATEAPRPVPVATGAPSEHPAPTEPIAPARPVPTAGSPAPQPPAPSPSPSPSPENEAADPPKPDAAGESTAAPGERRPEPAGVPRPLPTVPVQPRHRSTPPERETFRTLAEPTWERHSAAVNRALARMPALRGDEQEAARTDLIALRMYLRGDEGPLGHPELTRSLRSGEQRLVPYAGCLASGLGRLPSYRGTVLRGPGAAVGHGELLPGDLLRDPAPLSGLPLDPAGKDRVAGVGFAIWSITGRRVRQLLDGGDEVVFAPGTAFKVLKVRTDAAVPLVLLRQVRDTHPASTVLEDVDETALARLDHALANRTAPGTGSWPDRYAGPVAGTGDH